MTVDNSLIRKLSAQKAERTASRGDVVSQGPSGSGPSDPPMDRRVAALESDLREVKVSVQRIELSQARMEGVVGGLATVMGGLATKADIAGLKGSVDTVTARVDAQIVRITALEAANTGTVNLALSKTIGVPGVIGLFVSLGAVVAGVVAVLRYVHFIP